MSVLLVCMYAGICIHKCPQTHLCGYVAHARADFIFAQQFQFYSGLVSWNNYGMLTCSDVCVSWCMYLCMYMHVCMWYCVYVWMCSCVYTCTNTAIPIIIEGRFQVIQRFFSSKLVLKTVESCFVALNYYGNGSMCVCVHVCILAQIHTHIHTYMRAYIHAYMHTQAESMKF
jgi:hypothetical protein